MTKVVDKPIDYDWLRRLIQIEGLSTTNDCQTTLAAHKEVMNNFHKIFIDEKPPEYLPPIHIENRLYEKGSVQAIATTHSTKKDLHMLAIEDSSHNIKEHTQHLKSKKKAKITDIAQKDRIKILRRNLSKPPYERSAQENEEIYYALKSFEILTSQIALPVLKEVSVIARLEKWDEGDVTLLAHGSLFIILKGIVTPLTTPYIKLLSESDNEVYQNSKLLEKHELPQLKVGDAFGSLKAIKQPREEPKILQIFLPENGVEFLKISGNDFDRIVEQFATKNHSEKISLLLENPGYTLWSRQPLIKVADLLEFLIMPPNTVIVSEGFRSPFIAYIKSGSCTIMRKLCVNKTLKNGNTVKKTVHVVIGSVGKSNSFGELSILEDKTMSCTVISDTKVEMAIVKQERVQELDSDTKLLIAQSCNEQFGEISMENLENEYIRQESSKEWNDAKQNVVMEVINSRGIRPGFGKWAK